MLARSLRTVRWGMAALLSGAAGLAACTDGFSSSDCRETRTCPKPAGEAGEAGALAGAGGAPDAFLRVVTPRLAVSIRLKAEQLALAGLAAWRARPPKPKRALRATSRG